MNVDRTPSARDQARLSYEETRREVVRDSRERVRGAREDLARLSEVRAQRLRAVRQAMDDARAEAARTAFTAQGEHGDRVEISDRGRILAGDREEARVSENDARVAELKDRFQKGRVNTPEAIERAASRLLRGD